MVFITPKSKQLQIHWHHDTNAKNLYVNSMKKKI